MAEMKRTESFAADRIEASKDDELSEQDLAAVSGGSFFGDVYDAAKAVAKAVVKIVKNGPP
jgi:hypothetical protein